jgi:type I restriction enzyme, R subunit
VVNKPRDLRREPLKDIKLFLNHNFINNTFAQAGAASRVDKLLNNQLDEVLEQLARGLWG